MLTNCLASPKRIPLNQKGFIIKPNVYLTIQSFRSQNQDFLDSVLQALSEKHATETSKPNSARWFDEGPCHLASQSAEQKWNHSHYLKKKIVLNNYKSLSILFCILSTCPKKKFPFAGQIYTTQTQNEMLTGFPDSLIQRLQKWKNQLLTLYDDMAEQFIDES